jgi:hypothetical protein
MKLFIVLLLLLMGLMALRRSLSRYMQPGRPSPRDGQRKAREEARRREGEVTIDTSRSRQGMSDDESGEYVDYEEVK